MTSAAPTRRWARTALQSVWAAAVVGVLGLNLFWPLPGQEGNWPWVGGLAAFPVAAAVILSRRPGNGVGRALGLVGMAAALIFVLSWYALTRPDGPGSRQLEAVEAGVAVAQFVGIVALLYVFPTGRPLPGWHTAAFRSFLAVMAGLVVAAVLNPAPLQLTGRANPFGIGPPWLSRLWEDGVVLVPAFALLGVVSLVGRRRRAGPVERAQLKWFVAGASLFAVMIGVAVLTPDGDESALVDVAAKTVMLLAFWGMPAAVMVAVLRYRLFEIDRLVSRTVTYAVVATVLAAVYATSVVALQTLLPLATSDLAVAASTLAVATLFVPVRRAVQRGLDRRFHRSRYRSEQEVAEFVRRLRDELDLDALTAALHLAADRTMRPKSVHVWLAGPPVESVPHPRPGPGDRAALTERWPPARP